MCPLSRSFVGALAFAGVLGAGASAMAATRPFYVIAHMTNTTQSALWALGEGANALEMDLRFTSGGQPDAFRHGGVIICDCICIASIHNVCWKLSKSCEAKSTVAEMFRTLASQTKLALLLLDTKMTGSESSSHQGTAGARIVAVLGEQLFSKGYRGKVIISTGHADAMTYLTSAARAAASSKYGSRIYFTFDQEGGTATNAACTLKTLTRLPSKNIVYGTGISACATGDFTAAVSNAGTNRDAGVAGLVYVWTLDKKSSMRTYIDKGVNGILTNVPRDLVAVAKEKGLTLATPESPIPAATSTSVTGGSKCDCDCDYHPGGCTISKPAPGGKACKCKYKGAWTCGGSVVDCKYASSPFCKSPDASVSSCVQGGGDCDGYKSAKCDCNYQRGGCYIAKVAPKGTACKCKYRGAWTCGGSVVRCKDESSRYCASPDTSKGSCQQGGGDCGAKRYK